MVPASGQARLRAMLRTRSEWCISRQRVWGVPIPVLYNTEVSGRSNHLYLFGCVLVC